MSGRSAPDGSARRPLRQDVAVTHLINQYGLVVLFLAILLEAVGLPLPGETALIAAGIAADRGDLNIAAVIVVAAASASVGGPVGYVIGRTGGRQLLERWHVLRRLGERVLPPSEQFFERHGSKTVFLARFLPVLRVTAAWMAGVGEMPFRRFAAWNTAGSICWGTAIGLLAYYAGRAAADAIQRYGLYGVGGIVVVLLAFYGGMHLWKRRAFE